MVLYQFVSVSRPLVQRVRHGQRLLVDVRGTGGGVDRPTRNGPTAAYVLLQLDRYGVTEPTSIHACIQTVRREYTICNTGSKEIGMCYNIYIIKYIPPTEKNIKINIFFVA